MIEQKEMKYPNILNYELTFKVTGLSFLFCDLLATGFEYLEPLFTSSKNEFRQYLPNEKMEWSEKFGLEWLSKEDGFDNYQKEFEDFHTRAKTRVAEILSVEKLTEELVKDFFEIFAKYLNYYSKTDFQFTNRVYKYADENPVIKTNLEKLGKFKDVARVWVNETVIDEDSVYAQMVSRIAKQFGFEEKTIENYKAEDVLSLFDGSSVQPETINDRSSAYVIYFKEDRRNYLVGGEATSFIGKVKEIETEDAERHSIRGQVASKVVDTIEGIVRIINVDYGNIAKMNQEIAEMEKGEILVAEFTAPELMLACQKAKAIVTDMGGVLSHAAIVSRELKIPCVVGTHTATKALKNGDKISIDLNTGVVNKL